MPILQRLRWGQLGFANLRYATGPDFDLEWECSVGAEARGEKFGQFDCGWVRACMRACVHVRACSTAAPVVCNVLQALSRTGSAAPLLKELRQQAFNCVHAPVLTVSMLCRSATACGLAAFSPDVRAQCGLLCLRVWRLTSSHMPAGYDELNTGNKDVWVSVSAGRPSDLERLQPY